MRFLIFECTYEPFNYRLHSGRKCLVRHHHTALLFFPSYEYTPHRAILHDPQPYPDPLSFKPERFLKENGKELPPDPINFAFGFGRR